MKQDQIGFEMLGEIRRAFCTERNRPRPTCRPGSLGVIPDRTPPRSDLDLGDLPTERRQPPSGSLIHERFQSQPNGDRFCGCTGDPYRFFEQITVDLERRSHA